MKPIVVTGGAGYIGSHTVCALLDAQRSVVVVDNLSAGRRKAVPDGVPFVQADTRDLVAMQQVMRQYQPVAVMHFAAFLAVEESVRAPLDYYDNNVIGTIRLLQAAVEVNVRHFIFSSSCAIFGQPKQVPISEDMPKLPESPYGQTKLAVEQLLPWVEKAYGLRWTALRYFNAAGAHENGQIGLDTPHPTQLIPATIQHLLKGEPAMLYGTDWPTPDGTCMRDYIHVVDLAEAHIKALEHLEQGGESAVYNLGTGFGTSNRQIVVAIEKAAGKKLQITELPRRAGDPAAVYADPRKAERELNWKPRFTDIDEIVASAWKWHSTHPKGYEK